LTEITIVRNDVNFLLEFTIKDTDDKVVDLTGVSAIVLKFRKYNTTVTPTSITGSVVSATAGTCQFDVGTNFQSITGEYKAEIQITYGSGKIITAPNITIKVIEDLS